MQRRPSPSFSVTFERGRHVGVDRAEIRRRIGRMIALLQLEKSEVSFVLTSDKRIHELNKLYRGMDRPTDVLAFAMQEGELAELAGALLGDVIVSVPTARKQAQERAIPLVEELTMLLAHGLLHLLGWDHATAAEDRRMRAETDRLCAAARAGAVRPSKQGASPSPTRPSAPAKTPRSRTKVQSLHRLKREDRSNR